MSEVRPWKPGDPITADRLNQHDKAARDAVTGGSGVESLRVGNDVVLRNSRELQIPVGARIRAKVVSINDDYLTCSIYNAAQDSDGSNISVAKPYLLQQTPFDGLNTTYLDGQEVGYSYSTANSYTRTATDQDTTTITETQFITPNYFVGEVLWCERSNTGLTDDNSAAIYFEDVNTGARAWAVA